MLELFFLEYNGQDIILSIWKVHAWALYSVTFYPVTFYPVSQFLVFMSISIQDLEPWSAVVLIQ